MDTKSACKILLCALAAGNKMSRFYLNKLRLALMAAILANRTTAAELTLLTKINRVRKCTLQHDPLTVLLNIRIRDRDCRK